jgi:hypothetical protein
MSPKQTLAAGREKGEDRSPLTPLQELQFILRPYRVPSAIRLSGPKLNGKYMALVVLLAQRIPHPSCKDS